MTIEGAKRDNDDNDNDNDSGDLDDLGANGRFEPICLAGEWCLGQLRFMTTTTNSGSGPATAERVPMVGIIMGSDSDLPIMREAAAILAELGVPYEMSVLSAHRTPRQAITYAETALERGLRVVIAGAGGAAHLPGVVAAMTPLPVIGVPIKSAALGGQDSLFAIVQMPAGVPVATVAIDGARNAGILAAQILGTGDAALLERVAAYKRGLEAAVLEKSARLRTTG